MRGADQPVLPSTPQRVQRACQPTENTAGSRLPDGRFTLPFPVPPARPAHDRSDSTPCSPKPGVSRRPPEFAAQAAANARLYRAAPAPTGCGSGRTRPARWMDHTLATRARVEAAARQVVRGRPAQRLRQLPRPPPEGSPAQQGGDHLGGRAGRPASPHLLGTAPGGEPLLPTRSRTWASSGATGWRSTCR